MSRSVWGGVVLLGQIRASPVRRDSIVGFVEDIYDRVYVDIHDDELYVCDLNTFDDDDNDDNDVLYNDNDGKGLVLLVL